MYYKNIRNIFQILEFYRKHSKKSSIALAFFVHRYADLLALHLGMHWPITSSNAMNPVQGLKLLHFSKKQLSIIKSQSISIKIN